MPPLCRRCGCAAESHRHHRPGRDCGACGRDRCPAYAPPGMTLGDWLWMGRALLALWRTRHY